MSAEHARAARFRRLERVRKIEHRQRVGEAALAEAGLAAAETLARRTAQLSIGYARPTETSDGAALARFQRFAIGLEGLHAGAIKGAAGARTRADEARRDAATAEKRAEAVALHAANAAAALVRREYQRTNAELARKLKDKPRHLEARET